MKPPPSRSRLAARLIFTFFFFFLFAAQFGASRATAQEVSPSNNSETRRFTVTVVDKNGRVVSGLTKDAFAVFEGKTQREISYFNEEEAPASVGIMIDVSRSVNLPNVHASKLITAKFIQRSHPVNEYFIGEFNNRWRELTGWTRDEAVIVGGLRKAATMTKPDGAQPPPPKPYGLTALYDACLAALEKVAQGKHPKRVLLIITDGGADNASKHKFSELKSLIKTSDVLIYALAVSDPGWPDQIGARELEELTALSGGRAYFVDTGGEVEAVIDRIVLELRHQYVVGFSPTNSAAGGKWNKVKIKVTPHTKGLKSIYVRTREGYFSPTARP